MVSSSNTINADIEMLHEYRNRNVYVVSIATGEHPNLTTESVADVLRVAFDDVESDDEFDGCRCMTCEDADAIIDFFIATPNDCTLIVQCDGGVSRSAGIAAALLHIDGEREDCILMNQMMCPNKLCFEKTLQSYYNHMISHLMKKFDVNEYLHARSLEYN